MDAETLPIALLLGARVLPLAVLLPAATSLGTRLGGVAIGLALTGALLPIALGLPHPAVPNGALLAPALLVEGLRGLVFAFAVSLPVYAFAWAGELSERMSEAAPDDASGARPTLSTLYRYGALAVAFASGAHLLVLDGFAKGLERHPLGSLPDTSSGRAVALAVLELASGALALSISLAAPVLLGVVVLTLVLGLLSRISPYVASPRVHEPLVPAAGLGIICLVIAFTLPEAETALRVFLLRAEAALRHLG